MPTTYSHRMGLLASGEPLSALLRTPRLCDSELKWMMPAFMVWLILGGKLRAQYNTDGLRSGDGERSVGMTLYPNWLTSCM